MDISGIKDEISKRVSAGESIRMIAASFGIDHSSLSKAMKREGLYVPSRTEAAKNTWKNHVHPHLGKHGEESYMFGHHPSPESIAKTKAAISGPKNYHWSGGRKKHSQGYILVYAPDHPCRDRNGFVLEHRLVMEQHIGRLLDESEIVHHKNGIKSDNRLENLQVMSRADHAQLHRNILKEGVRNS